MLGPGMEFFAATAACASILLLMADEVAAFRLVATPTPLAVLPTGSWAARLGTLASLTAGVGAGLLPEA